MVQQRPFPPVAPKITASLPKPAPSIISQQKLTPTAAKVVQSPPKSTKRPVAPPPSPQGVDAILSPVIPLQKPTILRTKPAILKESLKPSEAESETIPSLKMLEKPAVSFF